MALKDYITQGIGAAPGSLLYWLNGGLGSGVEPLGPSIMMTVPYHERTMIVPYRERTMAVPYRERTMTVPRKIGME
jgi:hypothetical protein